MSWFFYRILVLLLVFVVTGSTSRTEQKKPIVVTTSMLECAAREVIPPAQGFDIVRILPPSACPGHFDLSPRVVPLIRSAVIVVRHDYQDMLEKKCRLLVRVMFPR